MPTVMFSHYSPSEPTKNPAAALTPPLRFPRRATEDRLTRNPLFRRRRLERQFIDVAAKGAYNGFRAYPVHAPTDDIRPSSRLASRSSVDSNFPYR